MSDIKSEKNKIVSAKGSSLIAQIVASVWIGGWSTYKFLSETPAIEDIMFSGLGIAACFLPVYFNLIMDKIKDIKLGGKS